MNGKSFKSCVTARDRDLGDITVASIVNRRNKVRPASMLLKRGGW